jgi:hypothetical protein
MCRGRNSWTCRSSSQIPNSWRLAWLKIKHKGNIYPLINHKDIFTKPLGRIKLPYFLVELKLSFALFVYLFVCWFVCLFVYVCASLCALVKSKSKLSYDRRSVVQSILITGHHLRPATNFSFSSMEFVFRQIRLFFFFFAYYGAPPLTRGRVCRFFSSALVYSRCSWTRPVVLIENNTQFHSKP